MGIPQPPQFSNYPRPQFDYSTRMWREPGVHFEAISDAITLIRNDTLNWILIVLVGLIAGYAIQIPVALASQLVINGGTLVPTHPTFDLGRFVLGEFIALLGSAITAPIFASFNMVALRQIRGEQIQIGDIFLGFKFFGNLIGTMFLVNLLVGVGFLCLIVPGIYLAGATSMSQLLVMDQGMRPVEAIKTSMSRVGPNSWAMFAFLLVTGILAGLGALACCVGLLVTLPVVFLGTALHYHYFFDSPSQADFNATHGFVPPPAGPASEVSGSQVADQTPPTTAPPAPSEAEVSPAPSPEPEAPAPPEDEPPTEPEPTTE